jgi:hypothetical protein
MLFSVTTQAVKSEHAGRDKVMRLEKVKVL